MDFLTTDFTEEAQRTQRKGSPLSLCFLCYLCGYNYVGIYLTINFFTEIITFSDTSPQK